jgi:hypothetical protein
MENLLNIIVSVDQPQLLDLLVERLATRRYDIGYCNEQIKGEWKAVETGSNEIYVLGNLEFVFENDENCKLPFITSFLFTCLHEKDTPYKLAWCSSLS